MKILNPLPKPDAERLIQKTVELLDRYGKLYSQYSGGRFSDYERYMASSGFADEDEFTKPKLFTDFLQEILGFPTDEYMPEHEIGAGVPDFQPRDRLLHPYFFEVKGSDSVELDRHQKQLHDYLKPPFRWGILVNMRDIVAYDIESAVPRHVSLLELYRAAKSQPRTLLDSANTRRFLDFVVQFRHKSLDQAGKVEVIKNAPEWALVPDIVPEELIASIHRVVGILTDDARQFKPDLAQALRYDRQRRAAVLAELDSIAQELDHRYAPTSDDRLNRFLNAPSNTLENRAFEVFLTRVAYFTMTRILIARMWEDIGFLEQRLYDGGFAKWYELLEHRIQKVLVDAFHYAGEKYGWLYGAQHNYFWYSPPTEDAIVNVLYEFARHNLGKLDTDVLGTVYEQFVDRVDRKNKGQYYTPREIIGFIWDRVGFNSEDAFFRFEDGNRLPRLILDVATGSGGFLVEAARRIRTQTKVNDKDPNELLNLLQCMYEALCGCEISQFAHYMTEVNLLIQLTPVIRRALDAKLTHLPGVTLFTMFGDSLGLAESPTLFPNGTMVRDRLRPVIQGDPKWFVPERLTQHNDFDYVCSNPPYVGEKGHKELFRATRADYPFWEKHYQGKMDYFYWFIILGLRKLREGGKLGFITTSYWPTADGASHLRQYILENSLILEIIDFGETRIFEGAPGQHNMVFVLEKCADTKPNASSREGLPNPVNIERKKQHRIKVVKVKAVPPARRLTDARSAIARVLDHIAGHIETTDYSDNYVTIQVSAVAQGELDGGPWALFVDPAAQTVLDKLAAAGPQLSDLWRVNQGVVPNPLRLTESKLRELPSRSAQELGLKPGVGVFVLSEEELRNLAPSDREQQLVKPYFKNSDIAQYTTSESSDDYLLYVTGKTELDKYPTILRHLEVFRPILARRRECEQGRIPWFSLHWAREESLFEGKKVVCSYRAQGTSFAYHEGSFYGSTDMYFIKPKVADEKHSLKYLTGILNSSVVNFWMSHKGKPKGEATEQFSTPLESIPIRRINFEDKQDVKLHDKVVSLVDEMIETKRKLGKLNSYFAERLTRLAGPERLPEVSVEVVTRSLTGSNLRRVHNHPKVGVQPERIEGFVLTRVGEVRSAADLFSKDASEKLHALELSGKGRKSIQLAAPKEILAYLQQALKAYIGKSWEEVKELPIAKSLATYKDKEKEIVTEARALLHKVESLQHKIDAIVYDLYGLTAQEIKTVEKT